MRSRQLGTLDAMVTLLIVLIVLALLGILGAVVEGLLWLTLVAGILLVASLAYGWFKLRGSS